MRCFINCRRVNLYYYEANDDVFNMSYRLYMDIFFTM